MAIEDKVDYEELIQSLYFTKTDRIQFKVMIPFTLFRVKTKDMVKLKEVVYDPVIDYLF